MTEADIAEAMRRLAPVPFSFGFERKTDAQRKTLFKCFCENRRNGIGLGKYWRASNQWLEDPASSLLSQTLQEADKIIHFAIRQTKRTQDRFAVGMHALEIDFVIVPDDGMKIGKASVVHVRSGQSNIPKSWDAALPAKLKMRLKTGTQTISVVEGPEKSLVPILERITP